MTDPLQLRWQRWEKEVDEIAASDRENRRRVETAKKPPAIIPRLYRFQLEWLAWALKQEASVGGGILADEMGMGKTVQALSLILATLPRRTERVTRSSSSGPSDGVRCTLVICKWHNVAHWLHEIERFTEKGSLRVLVFDGKKPEEYHLEKESLRLHDILLTTYGMASSNRLYLQPFHWRRIILDEAYFIKNWHSDIAQKIFSLNSSFKWVLSGTPLQNHAGELYSLVRFLQIYPYSYYLCEDCDCYQLACLDERICASCDHLTSKHFYWWNKYINEPMQMEHGSAERSKAMVSLKAGLLKSIMLRRTKRGRANDFPLPLLTGTVRDCTMDNDELGFYRALHTEKRISFDVYDAPNLLDKTSCISNVRLLLHLLLRKAADHPYLVIYSTAVKEHKSKEVKDRCGICHAPAEDKVVTSCRHVFCKACMLKSSDSLDNIRCPECSESGKMAIECSKNSGLLNKIDLTNFKTSTKLDGLREAIRDMVEDDGSAKGVVFSQFPPFLDLINFSLMRSGVKCVLGVGSMTEREAAIKSFTDDPDCRVMLMCLETAELAINLTAASYVFLMEPSWNPFEGLRAQERIHCMGQFKPVSVVGFITEGTIEEEIMKTQKAKARLFAGIVCGSPKAMEKLTREDLKRFFPFIMRPRNATFVAASL